MSALDERLDSHRLISAHRCTCGWEGDNALIHLVDVLQIRTETRNHEWQFVTATVDTPHGRGSRCGNRCRRCGGWALGIDADRAPETCPKADRRYVTEWLPLTPAVSYRGDQ